MAGRSYQTEAVVLRSFRLGEADRVLHLYTLAHGQVISKQDALRWAAETVPPEFRDLIEQVRQDRLVQWNHPPSPGSVDRSIAFVRYVRERARLAAAYG